MNILKNTKLAAHITYLLLKRKIKNLQETINCYIFTAKKNAVDFFFFRRSVL
jgi:hypothetical protein